MVVSLFASERKENQFCQFSDSAYFDDFAVFAHFADFDVLSGARASGQGIEGQGQERVRASRGEG